MSHDDLALYLERRDQDRNSSMSWKKNTRNSAPCKKSSQDEELGSLHDLSVEIMSNKSLELGPGEKSSEGEELGSLHALRVEY